MKTSSLVLALLAAGCGVTACGELLGLPTPLDERGALCTNGLDDDFDGLVDCLGVGCEGQCPEGGPLELDARFFPARITTCGNTIDDDGDGLVDALDAGCFAYLTPATTVCLTHPGITDDLPTLRNGGTSVLVAAPADASGSSAGLANRLSPGEVLIYPRAVHVGTEGLRFKARMHLGSYSHLVMGLVREQDLRLGELGDDPPDASAIMEAANLYAPLLISLSAERGIAVVLGREVVPEGPAALTAATLLAVGWGTRAVEIDSSRVEMTFIAEGSGEKLFFTGRIAAERLDDVRLVVQNLAPVSRNREHGSIFLRDVEVAFPGFSTCPILDGPLGVRVGHAGVCVNEPRAHLSSVVAISSAPGGERCLLGAQRHPDSGLVAVSVGSDGEVSYFTEPMPTDRVFTAVTLRHREPGFRAFFTTRDDEGVHLFRLESKTCGGLVTAAQSALSLELDGDSEVSALVELDDSEGSLLLYVSNRFAGAQLKRPFLVHKRLGSNDQFRHIYLQPPGLATDVRLACVGDDVLAVGSKRAGAGGLEVEFRVAKTSDLLAAKGNEGANVWTTPPPLMTLDELSAKGPLPDSTAWVPGSFWPEDGPSERPSIPFVVVSSASAFNLPTSEPNDLGDSAWALGELRAPGDPPLIFPAHRPRAEAASADPMSGPDREADLELLSGWTPSLGRMPPEGRFDGSMALVGSELRLLGKPGIMTRPIAAPVGDFEVSFDLELDGPLVVGLASESTGQVLDTNGGLFVSVSPQWSGVRAKAFVPGGPDDPIAVNGEIGDGSRISAPMRITFGREGKSFWFSLSDPEGCPFSGVGLDLKGRRRQALDVFVEKSAFDHLVIGQLPEILGVASAALDAQASGAFDPKWPTSAAISRIRVQRAEPCPDSACGSCVDPSTDQKHCGGCGVACEADELCRQGACGPRDDCPGCPPRAAEPPIGEACAVPEEISAGETASFKFLEASDDETEDAGAHDKLMGLSGRERLWRFTPAEDGVYEIGVPAVSGEPVLRTTLSVFRGAKCARDTAIAWNRDSADADPWSSRVVVRVSAGESLLIAVGHRDPTLSEAELGMELSLQVSRSMDEAPFSSATAACPAPSPAGESAGAPLIGRVTVGDANAPTFTVSGPRACGGDAIRWSSTLRYDLSDERVGSTVRARSTGAPFVLAIGYAETCSGDGFVALGCESSRADGPPMKLPVDLGSRASPSDGVPYQLVVAIGGPIDGAPGVVYLEESEAR